MFTISLANKSRCLRPFFVPVMSVEGVGFNWVTEVKAQEWYAGNKAVEHSALPSLLYEIIAAKPANRDAMR